MERESQTKLGRIASARFGFGGYQDVQIGLILSFEMSGTGVGDFDGFWSSDPGNHASWTKADQTTSLGETVLRLGALLAKAKVKDVSSLVGIPVEVTFEGNRLTNWRVLDEVIG